MDNSISVTQNYINHYQLNTDCLENLHFPIPQLFESTTNYFTFSDLAASFKNIEINPYIQQSVQPSGYPAVQSLRVVNNRSLKVFKNIKPTIYLDDLLYTLPVNKKGDFNTLNKKKKK